MRLLSTLTACAVAATLGLAASASAQTVCGPDITDATPIGPVAGCDRIWGDEPDEAFIVLDSIVFVLETDLEILPGTVIRGNPRNEAFVAATPLLGAPGTLVVERDSFLDARGTPGAPIVFTTAAVDNDDDGLPDDDDANGFPDDWSPGDDFLDDTPLTNPLALLLSNGTEAYGLHGGLVLIGSAPTNLAAATSVNGILGEGRCEGLPVPGVDGDAASYGGREPHDSSGHLEYFSVRHAGDEIDDADELNGITLCGVGDGTVMENIEGYANGDDGLEMFGGTVNVRNIVGAYVGDDTIDVDQGYTGVIQNAFTTTLFVDQDNSTGAVLGTGGDDEPGSIGTGGSGGSAGEFDGDDCAGNCFPSPAPYVVPHPNMVVSNWTHLSNVEGELNAAGITHPIPAIANADNQGVDADSRWCGMVVNSLFIGFGGAEPALEGAPHGTSGGPAPAGFAKDCAYAVAISTDGTAAEDWAPGAGLDALGSVARGDALVEAKGTAGDDDGPAEFIVGPPGGDCPGAPSCNRGPAGGGFTTTVAAGYQFLVNENHYFDPFGEPVMGRGKLAGSKVNDAGVETGGPPLDPRPRVATDLEVSGGVEPQWPGTDRSATYKGAFPADREDLWLEPWSIFAIGGLID